MRLPMTDTSFCITGRFPVLAIFLEDFLLLIIWLNFIGNNEAIAILNLLPLNLFTEIWFIFVDGWQFEFLRREDVFFLRTTGLLDEIVFKIGNVVFFIVAINIQQGLFGYILDAGLFLSFKLQLSFLFLDEALSLGGLVDLFGGCLKLVNFLLMFVIPRTKQITMSSFRFFSLHQDYDNKFIVQITKDQFVVIDASIDALCILGRFKQLGNKTKDVLRLRFIYIQNKMSSKILAILLTLAVSATSLKFSIIVDRSKGPTCFYENLKSQQKYLFEVTGETASFRMDVMTTKEDGRGWETVVTKSSKKLTETINKLAEKLGTYTFCVSSTEERPIKAKIQIQSGLEQINLEYLPNLDDHQMLDREIDWMEKQKNTMLQIISRQESQRSASENLKSMMGVTMIVLAILGLVVVAGVNAAFYLMARKTLKDRKLI